LRTSNEQLRTIRVLQTWMGARNVLTAAPSDTPPIAAEA
jgi:hypothetical protein